MLLSTISEELMYTGLSVFFFFFLDFSFGQLDLFDHFGSSSKEIKIYSLSHSEFHFCIFLDKFYFVVLAVLELV